MGKLIKVIQRYDAKTVKLEVVFLGVFVACCTSARTVDDSNEDSNGVRPTKRWSTHTENDIDSADRDDYGVMWEHPQVLIGETRNKNVYCYSTLYRLYELDGAVNMQGEMIIP